MKTLKITASTVATIIFALALSAAIIGTVLACIHNNI